MIFNPDQSPAAMDAFPANKQVTTTIALLASESSPPLDVEVLCKKFGEYILVHTPYTRQSSDVPHIKRDFQCQLHDQN